MSNKNIQQNYQSDFFVLRTPLLPFKDLLDLQKKMRKGDEMAVLRKRFKTIFSAAVLQEAIYIASPVLYDELIKFLKTGQVADKALISLYQYYSRMCTRCTPFGLFAGFNTGTVNARKTKINILSKEDVVRYCRLDMDYLSVLNTHITHKKDISGFRYIANSSTYQVADKLRYIETITNNNFRTYNITHVDNNALLKQVLKFTAKERPYKEIINFLYDRYGIPKPNARAYVNDLINAKLLVNNLDANVTGDEYMQTLRNKLSIAPGLKREVAKLDNIIDKLKHINNVNPLQTYKKVKKELETITPTINEAKLFQIDLLKKATESRLNNQLTDDLKAAAQALYILSTSSNTNKKIDAFKKLFEERFETEMVKLTDILDAEIGINYVDVKPDNNSDKLTGGFFDKNVVTKYKFSKYLEAIKSGATQVELFDEELSKFKNNAIIPNSLAMMVRVFDDTSDSDFKAEFRYASGPSAANLLGRFCAGDKKLEGLVKKILREEEALEPEKIFAEIAHVPQARIGNILTRPHLRKHEIQFLAQSDIKSGGRIAIQDLYLKLERGRLILFSKKHGKEIVPRLSSAHNYASNNLQIYHFLCDLQSQNFQQGITWSWDFLNGEEFLPRVIYKKIVLTPASWNLGFQALAFLKKDDPGTNRKELNQLRKRLHIPANVTLIEGDNELHLNLDLATSLGILKKTFKKSGHLRLKETLIDQGGLCVTDENGSGYANEVIIPLTKTKEPELAVLKTKPIIQDIKITRNFEIGSEWVYFKLYTGITTADYLIRDIIAGCASNLKQSGIIDKWFFIRYSDPHFHIRLRFHLRNSANAGAVVSAFSNAVKPLLESREINDFKMHSYKREIERYGAATMELSEDIFHINSETISRILNIYHQKKQFNANERFFVSLIAVDSFLNGFGLSTEHKKLFVTHNRNLFAAEFNFENTKSLKEQVQSNYRAGKPFVEALLEREYAAKYDNKFDVIYAVLDEEKKHVSSIAEQIRFRQPDQQQIFALLASYVHMYINRLIPANNRYNEFLMYEFLERYYISHIARNKNKVAVKEA